MVHVFTVASIQRHNPVVQSRADRIGGVESVQTSISRFRHDRIKIQLLRLEGI